MTGSLCEKRDVNTEVFMFLPKIHYISGSPLCERRDVNTEMLMFLPEVHYISGSPGSNDRIFV